jgi:nucleoside-diphosphate-sugar epimerase
MPPFNRLAVYGHRGWASSAIVNALIDSGAPVKVLYRPGSDVGHLSLGIPRTEVDVNDQEALQKALSDVDILMLVDAD